MKINKNYKFLSLFNLSYIEKYLQEIVNLSFEYASDFIFSYNIKDFNQIPINLFCLSKSNKDEYFSKFLTLLNIYLEKDSFFNYICFYLNFKFKIKFLQFIQLMCFRGSSSIKNLSCFLSSNLQYGLTFKDFILASFKTRESILDSSVNIYSSGYLTKKLIEGLRDVSIKEIKCNTKYICKNLYDNKILSLSFLCFNNKSICSFCLNSFNSYNMLMGYNKGVISGQALGEPSTQMLLRTFHLGGSIDNMTIPYYYNSIDNNKYSFYNKLFKLHSNSKINYAYSCVNYLNYVKANSNYLIKFDTYNCCSDIFNNLNIKFINLFKNFKRIWNFVAFYTPIFNSNVKLNGKKDIERFKYYEY
ncbi:RNA polymerase beta subunit rpoC2a (apicoplast) [Theileria orientalis]|uniref:DNA-directed RNA polymerase n=1 Tax=Theileria orientalis TaxID=68886 RepID=A0A976SI57_THEOR|nr:RNA polymerase beta subunit rpoC2a [Theileria orientalis]